MALSVPSNARVNFGNLRSQGSELFVSATITLDGSGNATVAHGFTKSNQWCNGTVGDTPVAAWFVPLDGEDESGVTLTVTATNVVIAGGESGGKVLVIALR